MDLKDTFFDNINGYSLDLNQRKIITSENNNILVVAGAGSGKTLTIVGKIKYLIEQKNVNPKDILCISFTNETVNSLKNKLKEDIDVYTFHKLSLEILKDNHVYFRITDSDYLEYIVTEYFESIIYQTNLIKYVINYFQYYHEEDLTYEMIRKDYFKEFQAYKKLIIKFINMIKSNNHDINNFKRYLKRNKYIFSLKKQYKNKCFLLIMFSIYKLYLEELNSSFEIDFDFMIIKAMNSIKEKGMKRYYKYIIIDEFQDTSMVRYNLIKAISQECDSKIFCVGDDFQSIYRFSGCTLDLFVNFKKYFKNAKIMYINKTYRNSLELVKIAYNFIIKNHYQLSKKIISNKRLKNPVKLVYYTKSNYEYKFLRLLDKLNRENKKEILVLGRCNHDLSVVYKGKVINNSFTYKNLKIKYLTVHTSKGLESEEVIVLNVSDDLLGFPNKLEDDEVLKLFFRNKERYLYAEERRLFYVALTRTKNNVYLMTRKNYESLFVLEIKNKCSVLDI